MQSITGQKMKVWVLTTKGNVKTGKAGSKSLYFAVAQLFTVQNLDYMHVQVSSALPTIHHNITDIQAVGMI